MAQNAPNRIFENSSVSAALAGMKSLLAAEILTFLYVNTRKPAASLLREPL